VAPRQEEEVLPRVWEEKEARVVRVGVGVAARLQEERLGLGPEAGPEPVVEAKVEVEVEVEPRRSYENEPE
jgi:hypothetical protein